MKDKDFINKKVDEIIQKALNNKDTFPTSKDLLKFLKKIKTSRQSYIF